MTGPPLAVVTTGTVSTANLGAMQLVYSAVDTHGNVAEPKIRYIVVTDTTNPTLTLTDGNISLTVGDTWGGEPGFTCVDNLDGSMSHLVQITGWDGDTSAAGSFTRTYTCPPDSQGNGPVTISRAVTIASPYTSLPVYNTSIPFLQRYGTTAWEIETSVKITAARWSAGQQIQVQIKTGSPPSTLPDIWIYLSRHSSNPSAQHGTYPPGSHQSPLLVNGPGEYKVSLKWAGSTGAAGIYFRIAPIAGGGGSNGADNQGQWILIYGSNASSINFQNTNVRIFDTIAGGGTTALWTGSWSAV